MKLFFNYSVDCELPPRTEYTEGTEKAPFLNGPESWASAEESVRGFVELMEDLDVRSGASLFVYPDVARHQHALYEEMAQAGVEIALHVNGMRYSRLKGDKANWLGAMTYDEQKYALAAGKEELEQVICRPCLGYRACYGSANNDTFPICEQLGFTWGSNASSRYRLDTSANWWGCCRYPHHTNNKCKLVCGSMDFFEMPITCGVKIFFQGDENSPLDLRVETAEDILGKHREVLRQVVAENLDEMARREVPVRIIAGASHNTIPYGQFDSFQAQNLRCVVKHTQELAEERGLHFVPASFADILAEAQRINSY